MKLKRSSLLTKIVVILPAVAAVATLVSLQSQLEEREAQAAALESQVLAAEQENQRLQEAIDNAGTDEGVQDAARQKLGMVAEGEIVFYDIGS